MSACGACRRRSALLGVLAPYIAHALREHRRIPALLSLSDGDLIEAVCPRKRSEVEDRLAGLERLGARRAADTGMWAICVHDRRFPTALAEGPDAPALLYGRGTPSALERLSGERPVALVGSRRASPYGMEVARALGRELGVCGLPVVSGMALGIDSAAHEGALDGGGLTIAVLAGGADIPYPRSRLALYRRIASAGLVVSELPPGARPFRWSFPARNRIMAGLSAMTVVVEGSDRSGSLITARFAADLGREVGAVPGQVTSTLASGPNELLSDGACVVRSAADVLDALYGAGAGAARRPAPQAEVELDERLRSLLDAVERGRGTVDAIASGTGDVASVLAGLTELELLGLIRRAAGGLYVRCA